MTAPIFDVDDRLGTMEGDAALDNEVGTHPKPR